MQVDRKKRAEHVRKMAKIKAGTSGETSDDYMKKLTNSQLTKSISSM